MTDTINQLIEQAKALLHGNEFLSGGLLLGFLATIVHQLRALPNQLYGWLKRRFTIVVDIPDKQYDLFVWLNKWLSLHPYSQTRARWLTVSLDRPKNNYGSDDHEAKPTIVFSPAAGSHWFFYKRRLVHLDRERKDTSSNGGMTMGFTETFTITMFTRNRQLVLDLLQEAQRLYHPENEKRVKILGYSFGDWIQMSEQHGRSLDSVILAEGQVDKLVTSIQQFFDRKEWYHERGIPWRFGILLSGPPGGGKSSVVLALATHFGLDVSVMSLKEVSDKELMKQMSELQPGSIASFEDIDALWDGRDNKGKDDKLTFSGLINSLDGVAAGEGRIAIMTTNHLEKLDPALIRPGRIDLRLEIGVPDVDQKKRMFLRFFPDAEFGQIREFVENCNLKSMAAIQGYLMDKSDAATACYEVWKAHL